MGVPPDQRDRLFERFFRASGSSMTGTEGTGLGLSIVRETVESLGGKAWAEFDEHTTAFAFSLPIRRASEVARLTPAGGMEAAR
jgi:signal transduction histidine kinase